MKRIKIFITLAGMASLLFGFVAKSNQKTDFQEKIGKVVKVDTTKYLIANTCDDPGKCPEPKKIG